MTPMQHMLLGVGASKKTYLDDVFSTFLYTGQGGASNTTITNGINLSDEGGMVWTKGRSAAKDHMIIDTVRGANKRLFANANSSEHTSSSYIQAFNNNGYSVGSDDNLNGNGVTTASWSFRKAPGFFDVVTWTGNSDTNQTISHSLASIPGLIIAKRTDSSTTGDWVVYHRDYEGYLKLNSTAAGVSDSGAWTPVTSTSFKAYDYINVNGASYVAYIFAGGESTAATARSVNFDGTGDYIWCVSSSDFAYGTGDFTWEFWFKPEDDGSYLLDHGTNGGAIDYYTYQSTTRRLRYYNSTTGAQEITDVVLDKGQWYHFAAVRSSGTTKLYLNGIEKKSFTDTHNYPSQTFQVGSAGSGTSILTGKMSNVRIVKGTAVYTSSFRPPTEPLTNITNTKLLFCNNSSVTGSTVTPGTLTASGNPTASTDSPFDDPAAFTFGDAGDQNAISTGSYIGNGNADGPEINLGWEPQWIMIKGASTSGGSAWFMYDSMRGLTGDGSAYAQFSAQSNGEEYTDSGLRVSINATGFQVLNNGAWINENTKTFIFLAIRRPDGYCGKPIKIATKCFAMDAGNSSTTQGFTSGFPVDFALDKKKTATSNWEVTGRLIQEKYLLTNSTNAEATFDKFTFDDMTGWNTHDGYDSAWQSWMWKRHAGFDVVTYTGTQTVRDIQHSMNTPVEFILIKNRSDTYPWYAYHVGLNGGSNPEQKYIRLAGANQAEITSSTYWNNTAPTSVAFTLGTAASVNDVGHNFIAMLFSSVDKISKCGFYDGSASDKTISLTFAPRFVIIKCTSDADDWLVLDTVRGWVSGNDSRLYLNLTNAEAGNIDVGYISGNGFVLNGSQNGWNNSGRKYIYYAHA